jgi:hypothetical protein
MKVNCPKSTSKLHDWSDSEVADFYIDGKRPTLDVCSNCGMIDDKNYVGKMVTFDFLDEKVLYEKGREMRRA